MIDRRNGFAPAGSRSGDQADTTARTVPGQAQAGSTQAAAPRDQQGPAAVFQPPAVALPKGGGALRGIGEKFAANPVTGTGSFTVPIPLSPGRSGFRPDLALAYDSGSGNGAAGLGWTLGLPSITRKTDKGLPRYDDDAESDVFILSGAEDLVPAYRVTDDGELELDAQSRPTPDRDERNGYRITRYRPRTEGLYARIERWAKLDDPTHVFWRAITRDNMTTIYGKDALSRIADPETGRIFSWLISESYDDKGNAVLYAYKAEDGKGRDTIAPEEQGAGRPCQTQRYIKSVRYGNVFSRLDPQHQNDWRDHWLFEVVFDYGEGHYADLPLDGNSPADEQHRYARASLKSDGEWLVRPDPFSTFRAGFEVRTYRRCHRVLMFHRIPELGAEPYLVRALELSYADLDLANATVEQELAHEGSTRFASFLMAVTQHGYERADQAITPGPAGEQYLRYVRQSLPPVEFRYSKPVIEPEVRTLDAESAENLPAGLGEGYQWVDIDAEGLSGALTQQGGALWYKRNKGGGKLEPLEQIASVPAGGLAGRQLLDLAGDGPLDLVDLAGPAPGFTERTNDGDWGPHRPFLSLPNLRWDNPNLRFVDLTGDGHADAFITTQDAFRWHESLGEDGFGPELAAAQPFDEDLGPRLVFADGTGTVFLADMSGDGLTDLVRINNGSVRYWPNLGYGRFGPAVVMDHPPLFDHEEQFDPSRVRLADVDGSGVTDILYLGRVGVRIYFNQSGNRWSDALSLTDFPLTDNVASVAGVDLLGNGTACLVWSSPLPVDASAPLKYVELMAGGKPHLLVSSRNNLGAETTIRYVASTEFYLKDKAAGQAWITRLPFPVHVVERVEIVDRVSRNRFVTRYEYHHGYFDGVEREFRGFGRVDQYDTEEYDLLPPAPNLDVTSYVPPVLTRTWFHTGVYLGRGRISQLYAAEYYRPPGLTPAQADALLLDDTPLPPHLSQDEEREACRALRGSMLRQEVYALDGLEEADYPFGHPYTVTEQNFAVRLVQPLENQRHAVFFTHPRETLNYHYERKPDDPRVGHTLTLAVNAFGQVTRSASIGYGRRSPDASLPPALRNEQTRLLATYTEMDHTNGLADARRHPDDHRIPAPADVRTYELTGPPFDADPARLTFEQIDQAAANAAVLRYEQQPTPGQSEKRLIERERMRYRRDDLSGPCAWDVQEPHGLPFEMYRLAFTPGLLARSYTRRANGGAVNLIPDPTDVLAIDANAAGDPAAARGGYVDLDGDGNWWIPTGQIFYAPAGQPELAHALQHFFMAYRYRNPFYARTVPTETSVTYDPHDLQAVSTTDALGNTVSSTLDYRFLAPSQIIDVNDNRSAVAFDALGMVVATALMGKAGAVPCEGDELADFSANLTPKEIQNAFADPFAAPGRLLGHATTRLVYDLFAYSRAAGDRQPAPAGVYTLARETHFCAPGGAASKIQHSFSYSDGFGREIQKKAQAEPGPAPARDVQGRIILVNGRPQLTANPAHRWTGSGWTEFNNKGKPVRQYEPFFSDTHRCDFDAAIGVTRTLFYDPVQRVVAVLHPNHSYEKVVFDPWRQASYDVNDTCAAHGQETGDPRTDPHVAKLVARHLAAQGPGWQTWLAREQAAGGDRADAATKAAAHADTPTVACFDTLGRTFLTRGGNGWNGANPIFVDTNVVLDIEGNQRALIDAAGRTMMTYDYDMLGNRSRQSSMEAGERWTLNDVTGNTIRAWDGRGHAFRTEYDALRRPVRHIVEGSGAASDPDTRGGPVLYARMEYGESQGNAAVGLNLRGRVFRQFDAAGIVTFRYDFKGNVIGQTREVAAGYKTAIDWAAAQPAGERYVAATRFDALNRPVQAVAPHLDGPNAARNVVQPVYNEANLLDRVLVWTGRAGDPADFLDPNADLPSAAGVDDIDYDAKGRRTLIAYRTGVTTTYEYDEETFRLVHLYTRRTATFGQDCGGDQNPVAAPADPPANTPCGLQNLYYAYDAAGNVTRIHDLAQQRVFFRNQIVDASNDYTYDPLYRLAQALGREHVGQAGGAGIPHDYNDARRKGLAHRGDGDALGRYCETYEYEEVGNILAMRHRAACPGAPSWSRTYTYDEATLLDDRDGGGNLRRSNRLTSTTVAGITETYSNNGDGYDPHGNLLRMPHLPEMAWDFRDQLRSTRRQALNALNAPNAPDTEGQARDGERTYYVYDGSGQRVRKVTEAAGGGIKEERLYLGGLEVYRQQAGPNAGLVRQTLHVMDDKQRIALVETRNNVDDGTPQEVIRYQHGNHLGSANLELDGQAQIISYEEYAPYGSTTYQAVETQVQVPAKRYRYTGKERDEESGLFYHGARYYAAWLGRWVSCDPAGLVSGSNLYAYVSDNPVLFRDPNGMQEANTLPPAVGLTFSSRGVTLGPINQPGYCDELSASCQSLLLPWTPRPQITTSVSIGGGGQASAVSNPVDLGVPTTTPAAPPERTFWSRGGGTMVAGGLALGIGAVLLLSNPVGWVVGLTAALSLSAGIAGTSIGASQLVLSYSGQTTAQQDEQLNEATSTMMMFAGSPGGIVGGTAGALYYGNEEGLRRGAFVGGLTEAGVTLAAGSGRMILREIEFGAPANSSWRAVRGGIQDVYGLENAADRMRPNPLFYQGIERMDLSHFVPQRATRGYEWFFNRPWNVTPAWATEHAMVDSFRYQFMSPAFKSVYAGQQLQGLERYLQLAPPWMLQSGYGLSRGGQVGLDWSLGPTPEESSQH